MSAGDVVLFVYLAGWVLLIIGSFVEYVRGKWSSDEWWISIPLGAFWPLMLPLGVFYRLWDGPIVCAWCGTPLRDERGCGRCNKERSVTEEQPL